MIGPLRTPLFTFALTGCGVVLAQAWFNGLGGYAVAAVIIAVMLPLLMQRRGEQEVTRHPLRALRLFEWRLLGIAVSSAALTAGVIIASVELAAPEGTDPATKELLGAVAGGVTAFIAGVAIPAGEADDEVGRFIRQAFQKKYCLDSEKTGHGVADDLAARKALPDGPVADAVFGLDVSWSREDRRRRLEELEAWFAEHPDRRDVRAPAVFPRR